MAVTLIMTEPGRAVAVLLASSTVGVGVGFVEVAVHALRDGVTVSGIWWFCGGLTLLASAVNDLRLGVPPTKIANLGSAVPSLFR
ncbi:hypothetical protein BJ973_003999 [Actinoplanes tereljensis]|nr:hypothetical protein [Actinoplanes tereljensis]